MFKRNRLKRYITVLFFCFVSLFISAGTFASDVSNLSFREQDNRVDVIAKFDTSGLQVLSKGMIMAQTTGELTLETPGRKRIMFTSMDSDGCCTFTVPATEEMKNMMFRAFLVTRGSDGKEKIFYSNQDTPAQYAEGEQGQLSDWVPRSDVPAGATIVNTRVVTKDSTNSSEPGYTRTGEYWAETGSGNKPYASFPDGFDTNHDYYQNWMKGPYDSWDNGMTKRDVSNVWEGYVYWHWMYDTGFSNAIENRSINNCSGLGNTYNYQYFGAFTSSKGDYRNDTGYCNNKGIRNYIVDDRDTSWSASQGAKRWFRFDYYRSYYTDYQKHYTYEQEQVQYRMK